MEILNNCVSLKEQTFQLIEIRRQHRQTTTSAGESCNESMTFGSEYQAFGQHLPNTKSRSYQKKNLQRKNNRHRNDRASKAETFQESKTSEQNVAPSAAIAIPRRRSGERAQQKITPEKTPYAAPKFSSPPPPSLLPKPPSHWIASPCFLEARLQTDTAAMTQHLRQLLKVAS